MFLFLLEYLQNLGVHVPFGLSQLSTRMVFAALTSLLITIFIGPRFINRLYTLKTGQSVRVEDCPALFELHKKKRQIPSMGGILILASMLISLFLWMDLTSAYTLILLFITISLGIVGGIDDLRKMRGTTSKGLSAKGKFLVQLGIGSLVGLYLIWAPGALEFNLKGRVFFAPSVAKIQTHEIKDGITHYQSKEIKGKGVMELFFIPFKKRPFFFTGVLGSIFVFFLTLGVITGTSNAVNLSDGLDGLASGLVVMIGAVLALVAFLSNHLELARYLNILYIDRVGEVAVFLCAMIGATLGFLWYNGHPAQVFMGDIGSLPLGGILGVSAVVLRKELLLALGGGVLVAEALSVIVQVVSYRYRNKKRVFLCAPLHHHFECKGWAETKVVLRFWIVALILALVAIASLKVQ